MRRDQYLAQHWLCNDEVLKSLEFFKHVRIIVIARFSIQVLENYPSKIRARSNRDTSRQAGTFQIVYTSNVSLL